MVPSGTHHCQMDLSASDPRPAARAADGHSDGCTALSQPATGQLPAAVGTACAPCTPGPMLCLPHLQFASARKCIVRQVCYEGT